MNNFLMSVRFNKQKAEDFGLIYRDGIFTRFTDKTEWKPCKLYDFGWGNENGFYKIPLASFDELIEMVLSDEDEEDSYGAASIILNQHSNELKLYLLNIIATKAHNKSKRDLKRINDIFKLQRSINLTFSNGMSLQQIDNEYRDWCNIASFFKKM